MGFTRKTFRYLADLEANNNKDWFEGHRADYETHWKEAALDFIAGISNRMAALDPPLKSEPKLNGSLRRINRDVRFSKDKSPYSPRLHMIFWAGDHPNRSAAVHFVLNPKGVGYGAGHFGLEPAQLTALRHRIAGPEGEGLIAALSAAGKVGCRMGAPALARLPKGFEAEGPRAELLRHKAITVRTRDKEAPASKLIGKNAEGWTMEITRALLPLVRWLHPN